MLWVKVQDWIDARKYSWTTDSANWYNLYPNLKVPVHAPKFYFRKDLKEDEHSDRIRASKSEDLSEFFMPLLRPIFNKRFRDTDLITVVPCSKVEKFSPTLKSIAQKLSKENSIANENIIERIEEVKKCTYTPKLQKLFENIQGTMALKRPLKKDEANILLIDDTKASGVHLLECAKLLKESTEVVNIAALCLGINKKEWD